MIAKIINDEQETFYQGAVNMFYFLSRNISNVSRIAR